MSGDYGVDWSSLRTSHGVGADPGLIRALLHAPHHLDRSSLRRTLPRAGNGPRAPAPPARQSVAGQLQHGSGKAGPEPHPLPPAAEQLQHRIRENRRTIHDCGHAEGWFVAI